MLALLVKDEASLQLIEDRLNPMRRPALPEEQARVGSFLASDRASFINGEAVVVDGGQIHAFVL